MRKHERKCRGGEDVERMARVEKKTVLGSERGGQGRHDEERENV